jgi:hypothetical protein
VSDVGDALRICVRGDPAAGAAAAGIVAEGATQRLLEAARRHRVVDAVATALRGVPAVDDRTLDLLHGWAAAQAAHQLRVLDDLRWFAGAMEDASVPWLAFKGPVLARLLYDPPTARGYQDLDLWIARQNFPKAIDVLEAAGARLLDANWTLIRRERRGQLHLLLPLGTLADVHWHLLNRASVRDSFAIDMDEMIARSRLVEVEGISVRTLDAVDTLLHLCLHAALGGADRLGWLEDVRRSIVVEAPSWGEVVTRARGWRAGAPIAVTLRRSRDLLGGPVPGWVLTSLDRSAIRRHLGEWIDRRTLADQTPKGLDLMGLWPELVRDGAWPTLRAVLARASRPVTGAAYRLAGEPGVDRGRGEGAVFKPSGTPRDRRRFMDAVAAGEL